MPIIVLLLLLMLTGCVSSFHLPVDRGSIWIAQSHDSYRSNLLLRGEQKAFFVRVLRRCDWLEGGGDSPMTAYSFHINIDGSEKVYGALIDSSLIVAIDHEDPHSCIVSQSTANTIRAIYQHPYAPLNGT